jgi:choline-sulfatase
LRLETRSKETTMRTSIALFVFAAAAAFCDSACPATERPNVVLIAVDDLNDWVGCLGGHPDTLTPHIDRLAARGTLFTNAHCQATICNPSRTSIMFGMRPSSTGFYANSVNGAKTHWLSEKYVSLPRHFAANGYKTFTTGKIYHGSALPPGDFDVVGPRPGQWNQLDKVIQASRPEHTHKLWDFGPQDYDEGRFQDHIDASWAIEQIKQRHDQPFFMAIGFYRPHVPFFSPRRIHESPDLVDGVALPLVKEDDWKDLSKAAYELTMTNKNPPRHAWMQKDDNAKWTEAVRAYLACVRWTDEQVGRLLDALDASPHAENTIIVFYSDHGFHLGEKSRWAKFSLWERSTRVPFIVSAPDLPKGQRCSRPTELLSIYPTLIELCELSKNTHLEGVCLLPLLKDANAEWGYAAITTLHQNNHTVRTQNWRYTRYADGSEELYDHANDPNEWTNLAGESKHHELIDEMKNRLPKVNVPQATSGFRKRVPPRDGY